MEPATAAIDEILVDPRYFPMQADVASDCLTLVPSSRDRLSTTPFLDGRTPVAEGAAVSMALSDALRSAWPRPAFPDRFIFHVGFCGSTLLASLLDVPGHSFAEREPGVLSELAVASRSAPGLDVGPSLDLVRALLRRKWHEGEHSLCKAPNLANSLIPELTAEAGSIRPFFLTTDKREYLYALFRGGRPRMEYVVRVTDHLMRASGIGQELWPAATDRSIDPLEVPARIALLSMHVQLRLFDGAMGRGGWGRPNFLTLQEIERDPLEACRIAARALELDMQRAALEANVAERLTHNAKASGEPYSAEDAVAANRAIEDDYGKVIDQALDWAAASDLLIDVESVAGSADAG